jgi:hypothetical protein
MEEILQKIEYSDHRQEIFDGALSLLCNLSVRSHYYSEHQYTLPRTDYYPTHSTLSKLEGNYKANTFS